MSGVPHVDGFIVHVVELCGMVGATVGKGEGEAGGSTGTGTSGVLPSRSCRSVRWLAF